MLLDKVLLVQFKQVVDLSRQQSVVGLLVGLLAIRVQHGLVPVLHTLRDGWEWFFGDGTLTGRHLEKLILGSFGVRGQHGRRVLVSVVVNFWPESLRHGIFHVGFLDRLLLRGLLLGGLSLRTLGLIALLAWFWSFLSLVLSARADCRLNRFLHLLHFYGFSFFSNRFRCSFVGTFIDCASLRIHVRLGGDGAFT